MPEHSMKACKLNTEAAQPLTGRIYQIQSLGAVDGPGLRYVVFMQGCPLRCMYCHNPETWPFSDGSMQLTPQELVEKTLRCKPYFEKGGGVTVTGGEPLMQSAFVAEYFRLLQAVGVHTALDTSGCASLEAAEPVLQHTNLVLADLKFLTAQEYFQYAKADMAKIEAFLDLTQKMAIPLWIRHVVVPGYTDSEEHIRKLGHKARQYRNLEKIELLPFRNLCLEKYQNLGIPFPLEGVPQMDVQRCKQLETLL